EAEQRPQPQLLVAPAALVIGYQTLDRRAREERADEAALAEQQVARVVAQAVAEPFVERHAEAELLAVDDRRRQVLPGDLLDDPLHAAAVDLQRRVDAERRFDQAMVQERRPVLDAG